MATAFTEYVHAYFRGHSPRYAGIRLTFLRLHPNHKLEENEEESVKPKTQTKLKYRATLFKLPGGLEEKVNREDHIWTSFSPA